MDKLKQLKELFGSLSWLDNKIEEITQLAHKASVLDKKLKLEIFEYLPPKQVRFESLEELIEAQMNNQEISSFEFSTDITPNTTLLIFQVVVDSFKLKREDVLKQIKKLGVKL